MKYASITEQGKRLRNEDCIFVPRKGEISLVIVADGMGGHNAGSTASALAVQTAAERIKKGGADDPASLLNKAVQQANSAVFEYANHDKNCRGMGTTMVMALLFKSRYLCANVGDSRLYHFSAGSLRQVTRDHSFVAELVAAGYITPLEARVHPRRNIITRALGTHESERVDLFEKEWSPGDTLLLCSDGLYGALDDLEMARILKEEPDLSAVCQELVQAALYNGSTDNISVVLVRNEEDRT